MKGAELMTNVNIIFDDDFEDVDIISVPDEIIPKIEEIGQEFLYWDPPESDSDYWIVIDGIKHQVTETDGFIKWLNSHYCQNTEKACIIARNTNYCPEYKVIEF